MDLAKSEDLIYHEPKMEITIIDKPHVICNFTQRWFLRKI